MKKSIMKKITVVTSTLLVALTVVVMSYGSVNNNLVNYVPQHNHIVPNYDYND
ncbi:MAG: hypothetical protein PHX70_00635 [Clostridium sp.]|nr:hypothetical protein [Clostridium sp.]